MYMVLAHPVASAVFVFFEGKLKCKNVAVCSSPVVVQYL